MEVEIREYRESDLAAMKEIWNEVVEKRGEFCAV